MAGDKRPLGSYTSSHRRLTPASPAEGQVQALLGRDTKTISLANGALNYWLTKTAIARFDERVSYFCQFIKESAFRFSKKSNGTAVIR